MSKGEEQQFTKTIIVTGLKDEDHQMEIRGKLERKFGVKEMYTIQNIHKVLFVIFYDERKAREAIHYLKDVESLFSHHVISKYEIPREHEKCDETKNQSTLLFTFRNLVTPVNDREFLEEVSKFGEVKDVRPVKNYQKCVEFYDSRSADAAFHNMNDSHYKGCTLQAKWVWDLSIKTRWEMIRMTDNILKECKLEIKPLKREDEGLREDIKKKKLSDSSPPLSRNIFLQKFDAFIASNIDLINEEYIG